MDLGPPLPQYDYLFKILIIGDVSVGKSSLLARLRHPSMDWRQLESTIPYTLKPDHAFTEILQQAGKSFSLQLWHEARRQDWNNASLYRGAQAILIAFDPTDWDSFSHTKEWVQEVDRYAREDVNKFIVCMKGDLLGSATVDLQQAKEFAQAMDIPDFVVISSMECFGLDYLWHLIVLRIRRRLCSREWPENTPPPSAAAALKRSFFDLFRSKRNSTVLISGPPRGPQGRNIHPTEEEEAKQRAWDAYASRMQKEFAQRYSYPEGGRMISRLKTYTSSQIGQGMSATVADELIKSEALRAIRIINPALKTNGLLEICSLLRQNRRIQTLEISDNQEEIFPVGWQALGSVLSPQGLKHLSFCNLRYPPVFSSLLLGPTNVAALQQLEIVSIPGLQKEVLPALLRTLALHAGSLRCLALRKLDPIPVVVRRPGVGNGLAPPPPPSLLLPPAPKNTSDPPDRLEELLEEVAVMVVALRETLTTLDLSQNSIRSLGVLSRAIAHSGVEVLLLEGNPLSAPARESLCQTLRSSMRLRELTLSEPLDFTRHEARVGANAAKSGSSVADPLLSPDIPFLGNVTLMSIRPISGPLAPLLAENTRLSAQPPCRPMLSLAESAALVVEQHALFYLREDLDSLLALPGGIPSLKYLQRVVAPIFPSEPVRQRWAQALHNGPAVTAGLPIHSLAAYRLKKVLGLPLERKLLTASNLAAEALAVPGSGSVRALLIPSPPPPFGAVPKQLASRGAPLPGDLQLLARMADDVAAVQGREAESYDMAQLDAVVRERPPAPEFGTVYARVIFDFEATEGDELSLLEGQRVRVTSRNPSGWWTGDIDGRTGMFPYSFVELE
jgi:GTPase SAR1 family protein/Leucine-rich repeat (LRR) protein